MIFKTIKELEKNYCYTDEIRLQTLKDILELIKELKNKIDNAEEDFGNLDWISKKQALEIIDRELKERIEGK